MSVVGAKELHKLRNNIDVLPGGFGRALVMAVDGSFANRCFLNDVPERTTVVARIRKDAGLRKALPKDKRIGNRKYGAELPTPDQMLSDPEVPTHELNLMVGGRVHTIKYKVVENVCWQRATGDTPARVILLKPLGYRLNKGSKLLYRQPGYLFVTGDDINIADAIKAYLLRWEIEVSFRDEKTILGTGKAQVWNQQSVQKAPAFLVACYAALLLASITALNDRRNEQFDPLAQWRNNEPVRPSTRDLVRLLRKQVVQSMKHIKNNHSHPMECWNSGMLEYWQQGLATKSVLSENANWGFPQIDRIKLWDECICAHPEFQHSKILWDHCEKQY